MMTSESMHTTSEMVLHALALYINYLTNHYIWLSAMFNFFHSALTVQKAPLQSLYTERKK